jgi:hypothetical protein
LPACNRPLDPFPDWRNIKGIELNRFAVGKSG